MYKYAVITAAYKAVSSVEEYLVSYNQNPLNDFLEPSLMGRVVH
jgi:hypothetical protein